MHTYNLYGLSEFFHYPLFNKNEYDGDILEYSVTKETISKKNFFITPTMRNLLNYCEIYNLIAKDLRFSQLKLKRL